MLPAGTPDYAVKVLEFRSPIPKNCLRESMKRSDFEQRKSTFRSEIFVKNPVSLFFSQMKSKLIRAGIQWKIMPNELSSIECFGVVRLTFFIHSSVSEMF